MKAVSRIEDTSANTPATESTEQQSHPAAMPLARPHESHETLLIAPIGKTPIKSEDCLLNAKPKLSGKNQATGKNQHPTTNACGPKVEWEWSTPLRCGPKVEWEWPLPLRLWPQSRVGMVTPTSLWPQRRMGVATPTSPVAPTVGSSRRSQSSVPVTGPSHRSQAVPVARANGPPMEKNRRVDRNTIFPEIAGVYVNGRFTP